MKTIKGFENEDIKVSDFGEWVGKDYIDYKFEYKNNQKLIKTLFEENQELEKQFEAVKEVATMHLKNEIQFKAQQKEFIEWLEKMVKDLFKKEEYGTGAIYGYILSKYKEITGDKE